MAADRLQRAALEYAELGLRVVPLKEGSKVPRIKNWVSEASSRPGIIKEWFPLGSRDNLGLAMGGGLVALDIDPARGGVASFRKLMGRRKARYTAVAHTGSGGFHYLFRVDPALGMGNRVDLLPGLDLRGEAGQIVAWPSIHPDTGRPYEWIYHPAHGIAKAPKWLVEALLQGGAQAAQENAVVASISVRPGLSFERDGDAAVLTRRVIEKFPVTRYGQRNNQMVRTITSLLNQGYRFDLVRQVVEAWWRHFYAAGKIKTSPVEAPCEIQASMACILSSPRFQQSRGRDHRAEYGKIRLEDWQDRLIRERVGQAVVPGHSPTTRNRVTTRDVRPAEFAFVEALTVYFIYKVHHLGEIPLKGKRDDILAIIEDRRDIKLDNQQFERLKRKYISRPDKPASRLELAVQTRTGRQGVPSEYHLTGLLPLMALEGSLGAAVVEAKGLDAA